MNNKDVVEKTITEFFPMFGAGHGGMADRLSDKIVAALAMHSHYLFRAIEMLCNAEYALAVYCEGDPVTECTDGTVDQFGDVVAVISTDPKVIFEDTQAVDDCHIHVYDWAGKYIGWIYVTNCNNEDESICDYTCGEKSTFSKLLDNFE